MRGQIDKNIYQDTGIYITHNIIHNVYIMYNDIKFYSILNAIIMQLQSHVPWECMTLHIILDRKVVKGND